MKPLNPPRCALHPGRWSYGRDLCLECEAMAEAAKPVADLALSNRQRQLAKQDSFMQRYSGKPSAEDTAILSNAALSTIIATEVALMSVPDSPPDFTGGGGDFGGSGASGSW